MSTPNTLIQNLYIMIFVMKILSWLVTLMLIAAVIATICYLRSPSRFRQNCNNWLNRKCAGCRQKDGRYNHAAQQNLVD